MKFDMHMLSNIGLTIKGRLHDTVISAKLANENRASFELKSLAAALPQGIVRYEYMVDNYKALNKVTDYRQIPHELLTQYGCADVWNCFHQLLADYEILEAEGLVELYNKECEVMVALYAMERFGFPTDSSYEAPLKKELQELVDTSEKAIYDEAGRLFNINSGKQLYDVLMQLGVDHNWIPTSEKGNPTLDKDVLQSLANKNVHIVQSILEYRKYEKLLGTYAIGIYDQRDAATRVHCNINQTEATTGIRNLPSKLQVA